MTKIGIITILNVNNYGAELQAFALHHKLKLMGYDNEIINYLYYKNSKFKRESASAPLVKSGLKNKLKDFVLKWIDNYSALKYPSLARERKERFNSFHLKNTSLSKVYNSYSDLFKSEMDYDTYIVGSDQVWNPNNGTNLAPYFLTFAPKSAKKISYASSFGVGSIPKNFHDHYKKWLNNIEYLGTRESDGVRLIKEITGRNASHVVDPTLLLNRKEWEQLAVPFKHDYPYILFFVFKKNSYAEKLAFEIQKKTGYKIIRVCKNEMPVEKDDKILNIRNFGPSEFLGLYQNASFVITTSFHGSIFSMIFEKPFLTITPSSKNNNSRQQSLMEMVGLEDRLLTEGNKFDFNLLDEIDYVPVRKKLNEKIKFSEEFLENALSSK